MTKGKHMKKITALLLMVGLVGLVGCGSSGSGSSYTKAEQDPTQRTTVYSGGGDVDVNAVTVGQDGTYIDNTGNLVYSEGDNSGNVTGDFYHQPTKNASSDAQLTPDEYASIDDAQECKDTGGSWCSIAQACSSPAADGGGTCPYKH